MINAFNIAKNPTYDGYNVGLFQWFISFFGKKSSAGRVKNQIVFNKN